MQQYTYLFINLLIFLVPFLISLHPRFKFYTQYRYVGISLLVVSTIFIIWDIFFTSWGVWAFNPKYITGIKLFGLPVEEILFFITVPLSCLFVHHALTIIKADKKVTVPGWIIYALGAGLLIISILNINLTYTFIMFAVTGTLIIFIQRFFPWLFSSQLFWLYSLITLFLFIIFNYLLTSIPVVTYNSTDITNLRILTIPIEDFFYNFSLLTSYLLVFTIAQKKHKQTLSHL